MKILILTMLLTVNAFSDDNSVTLIVNQEFTATIDSLYCENVDEFYRNVELKSESERTNY